ncbi:MAG: DUF4340 domain-containing protein [Xanthomonadales bacterium]|nr:DUF4340 domain-containing protein [Xanthomonadales bacterium]MDH4018243.1 DUF4340 domain-containing protein [Xanthomonadales bacterium]
MKRSFLTLAILTMAALIVVIMFALKDGSPEKPVADTLLVPAIASQINEVDRVEIVTAGNTNVATLVRAEGAWQLEQLDGYRADWSKLQALLAALAQASVIEAKTDNPDYYSRLGVEDVAAADAGSVLVNISIGDETTGLLIGHRAQGRQGQYVRLKGVAGSLLVDREFEIPAQTRDWADTQIIDVNSSEVAEVEIIHPTSERILVMRISADQTDFDLAGLPSDREIKSSWAVNSLGSVFSLLNLETVRPEGDVDWTGAVRMRMLMFSGVEIMADLVEQGDEYLLRLQASHPGASVVKDDSGNSVAQQEIEQQAADDVAKEVERINQKAKGWVYGISKQKFEAMVKKPEDLLKPLETT